MAANMIDQLNQSLYHSLNQSFPPNGTDYYCHLFPEDPSCWYVPEPFKLTTAKIISAVVMGLLIIIALGGNVLLCTAFLFYRRLRKTTNYFIISLAVSDILVAAVAMPMWISHEVTGWVTLPPWIDFFLMYKFWLWLDILSGVSSITNLAGISVDRFFSIMSPLLHRTRMTSSVAIGMIALAWVYSIGLASLSFAEWAYYTLTVAVAGFFVPLLVIVISYSAIYWKVKNGFFNKHSEKDWNLERTLLIVICIFFICWMPFFLFSLLYHYCRKCTFDKKSLNHIISFVKWMHYLNSCCNPFIYGIFNTNFKMAFKALLKQCFGAGAIDSDITTAHSDVAGERSIIGHIRSIRRKLRNSRKSNKNGLLFTEAETMMSTMPSSNRNSNAISNNACGNPLLNESDEAEQLNSFVEQRNGNVIAKDTVEISGSSNRDRNVNENWVNNYDLFEKSAKYSKASDLQRLQFLNAQESNV